MKTKLLLKGFVVVIISLLIGCKDKDKDNDKDKPVPAFGSLDITVKSLPGNNPVVKAYVFINDSLYGITDVNGSYSNDSILIASYTLICSAINLRDTSLQIDIKGGTRTQLDFTLDKDTSYGLVFGEFQDLKVFRQKAIDKPVINTWNEKDVFDGVTGATIYQKGPQNLVPLRNVSLDDSIISVSDAFGQYWFKIQSGTYEIKGARDGYFDAKRIITVLPDSKMYVNFYLEKK